MEQMKKYFAGMYKGLDLSECPIIAQEEDDDDNDDDDPSSSSEDDDDDPFVSIDGNGDFDPFLDYPGESNDIGDPAPSQARMDYMLLHRWLFVH